MKQIARLGLIGAVALASAPAFARSGGSFIGMGDLPGGNFYSLALAASADGSVVVGASDMGLYSYNYNAIAARWTPAQGVRPLNGLIRNNVGSLASAVSGNGLSIGGGGYDPDSGAFAFVWSQALGLTVVSAPSNIPVGSTPIDFSVRGLSFDASVGVGDVRTYIPLGNQSTHAFRWTPVGGATLIAGLDEIADESSAVAISADGQVIVGSMSSATGYSGGFRWSEEAGVEPLGEVAPDEPFRPAAISADGATIIGNAYTFNGGNLLFRAFRWTRAQGLVALQMLGASPSGEAYGVSGDGRLIVGWSPDQALIWRGENPPMLLTDYLSQLGVIGFENWLLLVAYDISADGRTIVGDGLNPNGRREGFIATIPPHCPGDADRDGAVSFADISAILTHWQGFGPQGDANDDFIVDFNDITETLTNWQGECP